MSTINPEIGRGSGPAVLAATTTGVGTAAVLPKAGMDLTIEIAAVAAAALVAWAIVYAIVKNRKVSR